MPNRHAAQVNNHDNAQAQVSFPVNIEAAFRAQATRTSPFSSSTGRAAYAKHPMMLRRFLPVLRLPPRDRDCHGRKQLMETESQAPRRWFGFGGSPNPQRQGGLAFCACPAPDGENASLARGGQPMRRACS